VSRTVSRPPRAAKPRPRSAPAKKTSRSPKRTIAAKKRKRVDKATRGLTLRLARSLSTLRRSQSLTQEAAAEASGLDLRHYQKLESGEVNAKLGTLCALANGFGVSPAELFGRTRRTRRGR
jgi:DNA-binding XRE family transcriptional regulator